MAWHSYFIWRVNMCFLEAKKIILIGKAKIHNLENTGKTER